MANFDFVKYQPRFIRNDDQQVDEKGCAALILRKNITNHGRHMQEFIGEAKKNKASNILNNELPVSTGKTMPQEINGK